MKIGWGFFTRSMVVVADGIHSLSDGASNIVGLVGMSIASHPADPRHPYGHRKYETIASLVISFTLFFVTISILKGSIRQLFRPVDTEVNAVSFGVMGITLGVNGFTAWWERRKGAELRSDLLIADSWHTFSDVFVTASVLAALLGIGMGLRFLDSAVAIGIAVFIAFIATRILRSSIEVLSDHAALDEKAVRAVVMGIGGVRGCHEIRSRGRQDDIRVDLHILVDPRMSVEESHRIANLIERDIRGRVLGVSGVLVHIEPSHHDHKELGRAP